MCPRCTGTCARTHTHAHTHTHACTHAHAHTHTPPTRTLCYRMEVSGLLLSDDRLIQYFLLPESLTNKAQWSYCTHFPFPFSLKARRSNTFWVLRCMIFLSLSIMPLDAFLRTIDGRASAHYVNNWATTTFIFSLQREGGTSLLASTCSTMKRSTILLPL